MGLRFRVRVGVIALEFGLGLRRGFRQSPRCSLYLIFMLYVPDRLVEHLDKRHGFLKARLGLVLGLRLWHSTATSLHFLCIIHNYPWLVE
jgi:hypothetical protein